MGQVSTGSKLWCPSYMACFESGFYNNSLHQALFLEQKLSRAAWLRCCSAYYILQKQRLSAEEGGA